MPQLEYFEPPLLVGNKFMYLIVLMVVLYPFSLLSCELIEIRMFPSNLLPASGAGLNRFAHKLHVTMHDV